MDAQERVCAIHGLPLKFEYWTNSRFGRAKLYTCSKGCQVHMH